MGTTRAKTSPPQVQGTPGGWGTHSQWLNRDLKALLHPSAPGVRPTKDSISHQSGRDCPWIPKSNKSQGQDQGKEGGDDLGRFPGSQRGGVGKGEAEEEGGWEGG